MTRFLAAKISQLTKFIFYKVLAPLWGHVLKPGIIFSWNAIQDASLFTFKTISYSSQKVEDFALIIFNNTIVPIAQALGKIVRMASNSMASIIKKVQEIFYYLFSIKGNLATKSLRKTA